MGEPATQQEMTEVCKMIAEFTRKHVMNNPVTGKPSCFQLTPTLRVDTETKRKEVAKTRDLVVSCGLGKSETKRRTLLDIMSAEDKALLDVDTIGALTVVTPETDKPSKMTQLAKILAEAQKTLDAYPKGEWTEREFALGNIIFACADVFEEHMKLRSRFDRLAVETIMQPVRLAATNSSLIYDMRKQTHTPIDSVMKPDRLNFDLNKA